MLLVNRPMRSYLCALLQYNEIHTFCIPYFDTNRLVVTFMQAFWLCMVTC